MRQMFMPGEELKQQAPAQTQQRTDSQTRLSARGDVRIQQEDPVKQKMLLHRALKKKRSSDYMNQIRLLDAGGQTLEKNAVDKLIGEIVSDLGPIDPAISTPIGIISKCYLGDPYEVHTLDVQSCIIDHYESGRPLPGALENFRGMAMNGSYELIEVYSTCACAIRANGSVTLIEI